MKAAALGLALFAMSVPALAGPCDEDIKRVDAALTRTDLSPDVRAQLQDMRNQAEKLCQAGNEEEAADVLAEASSILEGQ
ncbi:hypothetical protein [Aestuariivirga sp.]|uniref:hypothetical protein n=1 Tax=Aestuariivirga sp. TaxID=2650926 RepID=UPI003BAAD7A2